MRVPRDHQINEPALSVGDMLNGNKIELSKISNKSVEIDFDGGRITSDAGALFIREVERQIGIMEAVAGCIKDKRDQRYVRQEMETVIRQRVTQISCGYEDANDCNTLRNDPAIKMAAERDPISGDPLASQSTVSRVENSISRKDLVRIGYALADHFIASYEKEPQIIVLDFDDTEDAVHGAQQLSLFNAYYDGYCYQPLHVYEGLSGKLITTILRPGKRTTSKEVVAVLKRLIPRLRLVWKDSIIMFRGDSHFSGPETLQWLEDNDILYVIGQSKNKVLEKLTQEKLGDARKLYKETKQKVRLFDSFEYKANSWDKARKIVAKVEITKKGENLRYIVSNVKDAQPQQLYDIIYCARGNMENNIKDHKISLKSDRTSCHRFEANQFRLFLHSAAYILMYALRDNVLKGTEFASAQFDTIRLRVLKIGAQVRELKTRIKLHFPTAYPLKALLQKIGGIFKGVRLSINTT
jgi:hypothetical protein